MQKVKRFGEFLNENKEVNEKINWEAIPVLGGWLKARRERKEAEAKAAEERREKELRADSARLQKRVKAEYDYYMKEIKKNFAKDPELMKDKISYLQHYMYSSGAADTDGWDAEKFFKMEKDGKWEQAMKDLWDPKKNPYGFGWPAWVWHEDLAPDLKGIERDIKMAKGYRKRD